MSAEVVVRRARAGDAAARGELLRAAYSSLTADAFLYFYFHETTLQAVVLCGAALFIFGGCGAGALLAPPAGAALLLLAGAAAAHAAAAARAAARLPRERAGWVAEAARRPRASAPRTVRIRLEPDAKPALGGEVVGTVSLGACRDAAGGWLAGLGVARAWRRRGVARALLAAARGGDAAVSARGGDGAARPLHALVSALQPAARALFHDAGWTVSGCYARPLLGAAFTLPLTRLECDGAAPAQRA